MWNDEGNDDKKCYVYVTNIPKEMTSVDLYKIFKSLGKLRTKPYTNKAKVKYSIVKYDEISHACAAIEKFNNSPPHYLSLELGDAKLRHQLGLIKRKGKQRETEQKLEISNKMSKNIMPQKVTNDKNENKTFNLGILEFARDLININPCQCEHTKREFTVIENSFHIWEKEDNVEIKIDTCKLCSEKKVSLILTENLVSYESSNEDIKKTNLLSTSNEIKSEKVVKEKIDNAKNDDQCDQVLEKNSKIMHSEKKLKSIPPKISENSKTGMSDQTKTKNTSQSDLKKKSSKEERNNFDVPQPSGHDQVNGLSRNINNLIDANDDISFKDKDIVRMTHYIDGKNLYLVHMDNASRQQHFELINIVAASALQAAPITGPLRNGELVFCLSKSKDVYMRAQIKNAKHPFYNIVYLDSGMTDRVFYDSLRTISTDVKKLPVVVKKSSLANVSGDKPNIDVLDYINKLIDKKVHLICKIDNNGELSLKEEKTCINVNDHLIKLQTPIFDQLKEANLNVIDLIVQFISDIESIKLDELQASVEKPVQLKVLHMLNTDDSIIYCTKQDVKMFIKFDALTSEIQDYCSKQTNYYLPRTDELCLALYAGKYYRACALNTIKDSVDVYFLDYGNTERVHMKHIKKMIPKFVTCMPMLACLCKIKNFPSNCTKEMRQIVKEREMKTITVTSIKTNKEVGYDIIAPMLIKQVMDAQVKQE